MPSTPSSLGDLPVGARAVISALGNARPVARRLMELGLLPGTAVEVVRVAPMGDPLELRLRDYHLSVRREEARLVAVREVAFAR
ncbi:MAG: FeoA family protein [Polyangiales bacterium]